MDCAGGAVNFWADQEVDDTDIVKKVKDPLLEILGRAQNSCVD